LAYTVAFGWPEAWGPLEDVRDGLNFYQEVAPRIVLPGARESGSSIRLVMGNPSEPFWRTDPLFGVPGMFMNMYGAAGLREALQAAAWGPVAQSLDRRCGLKPEEKTYLAGLGFGAREK
jgi:hypothetical protein